MKLIIIKEYLNHLHHQYGHLEVLDHHQLLIEKNFDKYHLSLQLLVEKIINRLINFFFLKFVHFLKKKNIFHFLKDSTEINPPWASTDFSSERRIPIQTSQSFGGSTYNPFSSSPNLPKSHNSTFTHKLRGLDVVCLCSTDF